MNLLNHKKIAYMPQKEFRLLKQMYELTYEGLYYITYSRHFDSLREHFKNNNYDWYTHTRNSYYTSAIHHWCKLFGSADEPTYYTRLFDMQNLNSTILTLGLERSNIVKRIFQDREKIKAFNLFREDTINYRNKYSTHREHDPDKIKPGDIWHPYLNIPQDSFLGLFKILLEIFKLLSLAPDKTNNFPVVYDDITTQQALQLIEATIPNFKIPLIED